MLDPVNVAYPRCPPGAPLRARRRRGSARGRHMSRGRWMGDGCSAGASELWSSRFLPRALRLRAGSRVAGGARVSVPVSCSRLGTVTSTRLNRLRTVGRVLAPEHVTICRTSKVAARSLPPSKVHCSIAAGMVARLRRGPPASFARASPARVPRGSRRRCCARSPASAAARARAPGRFGTARGLCASPQAKSCLAMTMRWTWEVPS